MLLIRERWHEQILSIFWWSGYLNLKKSSGYSKLFWKTNLKNSQSKGIILIQRLFLHFSSYKNEANVDMFMDIFALYES